MSNSGVYEVYGCNKYEFYDTVEEALGDLLSEPIGTIVPVFVTQMKEEDVTKDMRLGTVVSDELLEGVYEKFGEETSREWCNKVEMDSTDTLEEKVRAAVREWLRENGRETELPIVCNGVDMCHVRITEDGWEWVE